MMAIEHSYEFLEMCQILIWNNKILTHNHNQMYYVRVRVKYIFDEEN